MANQITKDKIIVDTPGTTLLLSGPILINAVRWTGATLASTDHLLITDNESKNVIEAYGGFDKSINLWVSGIRVPTLSNGIVYIELE